MRNKRNLRMIGQAPVGPPALAVAIRGPNGLPPRHRPTGCEAALDAAFRLRLMQIAGNFRATTGIVPYGIS